MRTMLRFGCFAALLILAQSVHGAEPRIHHDVAYTEPARDRQNLDIYAPPEGKNHPIFFWIHGGGWMQGDKADVQHKPQALVDRGFVFVSTNYRLFPSATIKAMAADIAKAIRWTHDHAAQYGGDPDTMIVGGHSAGAQLAALLCTDESLLKAEGLPFSIIKGCVPVDGDTYDVPLQIASVEKRIADRYRWKFGNEQSQKDLSPVTHIARGKNIPPFLILYVADSSDTRPQSQRLLKSLEDAGISAKIFGAANSEHDKLNNGLGLPDDKPTQTLFEFTDRILKH
jgi:acetyl esterase/lipase